MRSKTPTTPHYHSGNYAGTGNPDKNFSGNKHWPGDSHPGADTMPKQSYIDYSLVPAYNPPSTEPIKGKPVYIPPLYGTHKPIMKQKAASKLRASKAKLIKK